MKAFKFIGYVYYIWFFVNLAMTGIAFWFNLYREAGFLLFGSVVFYYLAQIFMGPPKSKL